MPVHEFKFISNLAHLSKGFPGASNLQDDAATIDPTSLDAKQLVITKDIIVEGVHYLKGAEGKHAASKLIRTNLSDLASMGATPYAYLLGLALPNNSNDQWLESFTTQLQTDITQYGGHLIGGDTTTHDGSVIASMTAIGLAKNGILNRQNAQIGDDVWITGTIGDAHLGLMMLQDQLDDTLVENSDVLKTLHFAPIPRVELGMALPKYSSCAIDTSDGFLADCQKLCEASKVGIALVFDQLPFSKQAQAYMEHGSITAEALLNGGDDYELIFTAEPKHRKAIQALEEPTKTPIFRIGQVVKGNHVIILDRKQQAMQLDVNGYVHGQS